MTAAPPARPFREEARTTSVACVACGGPIALHGFGAIRQVDCPHCGSTLEPEPGGALHLLQQAQRRQRASILPLHVRGRVDGVEWEVIGIVWREVRVEGVTYPWQELLLFNPWHGFRWLVYQNSDGHFMFGGALDAAPRARGGTFGHRSVELGGERYRHFQSAAARVTYVEGELTWQVRVGDATTVHDYVAPPRGVSVEQSDGPEGAEIAFSHLRHVDGAEIWRAFRRPGAPPRSRGVGMLAPNPHRTRRRAYWLAFAALFVAWLIGSVAYVSGRDERVVLERRDVPIGEPILEEVELGQPGRASAIEVSLSAAPLENAWAWAEVLLVDAHSEEALAFSAEVDAWSGVAEGEAWSEGTNPRQVTIGGVDGGRYLLQIAAQADPAAVRPPRTMSVRVVEDVVVWRYVLLTLAIVLVGPIANAILGAFFEGRRWQASDYAGGS